MTITERKTKVWNGNYRGVQFEINNFKIPPNIVDDHESDNWTYYLYIHLNKIPKENNPDSFWLKGKADERGRVFYNYYENDAIMDIEFHGGCTWYSKERGFDGENKVIKIGCDYQHLWDEGIYYYIEWVQKDVMDTIDSFLLRVPDYKYCCRGNGGLYSLKEGTVKDGVFMSNEWMENKQK